MMNRRVVPWVSMMTFCFGHAAHAQAATNAMRAIRILFIRPLRCDRRRPLSPAALDGVHWTAAFAILLIAQARGDRPRERICCRQKQGLSRQRWRPREPVQFRQRRSTAGTRRPKVRTESASESSRPETIILTGQRATVWIERYAQPQGRLS